MNKLETRTEDAAEQHLADHQRLGRDRALLIVGGFKTALRISNALNSEVMRAMELFQEERLYLSFGYERFVDFLDNSEHSPMSKAQYYERRGVLEKEGDQVFDLLSDLGVSIRKRKLLGKGNVEIEGETVIIRDGEEQTAIELNDRARLLETLSALADANADKSAKIDRQKEKIEKHDEKVRELYAEIDVEKARQKSEFASDPHMMARVELNLALGKLTQIAETLSDIEKAQFRDGVLEELAEHRNALAHAYLTTARKDSVADAEQDEADKWAHEFVANLPNENDEELVAKL